MKLRIAEMFLLAVLFVVPRIGSTGAFFGDSQSDRSAFTAGIWNTGSSSPTPSATPTGTPAATPTPTATPSPTSTPDLYQSVVINEIMWMGSLNSTADEWIELRNMTDGEIDIGQWKLENVTGSGNDLNIPANKKIPANGFFLIANYPATSANSDLNVSPDEVNANLEFNNSNNGNIVLKTKEGVVIDKAKGTPWAGGQTSSALKKSMERNDTPGDGLSALSWHTCTDVGCNDTSYWDFEGGNYGTPKAPNLSNQIGLELFMEPGGRSLGFRVWGINLPEYESLDYLITYDSGSGKQGIQGELTVGGKEELSVNGLILGTCSEKACNYDTGVKNIFMKVVLKDGPKLTETTTSLE